MEAYGTLRDRELRHHYHDDLLQYLSEKNREQYALVPGERVIFSNRLDSILKKIRIFDKKHYRKIRRNFQEDLCIFVSRKEAETGIRFSVTLPVRRVCPQCFGNHGEECPLCDGLGMVSSSHPHILTLSPPLNHGEIQLVPVQGKPCKGAYFITRKLKVRIHIISNL
jgi:DnaJ-class molecular chaperone